MFAALFKRAEQTVDSAIGDLGNRIVIAIPFLIALGFGSASLMLYLDRIYGSEIGTLMVAAAFCVLGFVVALVVKVRRRQALRRGQSAASETSQSEEAAPKEDLAGIARPQSILDDETVMAMVTSAAPIVLPAIVRTGMKNWPIILAAVAGLYVVSRPGTTAAGVESDTSSQSS